MWKSNSNTLLDKIKYLCLLQFTDCLIACQVLANTCVTKQITSQVKQVTVTKVDHWGSDSRSRAKAKISR